jgi:hypothetical protein
MYFIGQIWQLTGRCRTMFTLRRRVLGSVPQQRSMRRPITDTLFQSVEFFFFSLLSFSLLSLFRW